MDTLPDAAACPSILLAEDDAVSARYLCAALAAIGCTVEHASDGSVALELARTRAFALLVLDLGLPSASGEQVLAALRGDPLAASARAPALALSADSSPALRRALVAQGFVALLDKPIAVDALARAVRGALSAHAVGVATLIPGVPEFDDAAALQALGSSAAIADLRHLLAAELPAQCAAIDAALAAGEPRTALAVLHRLKASTGFCGTPALAAAGTALAQALHAGSDPGAARAALARAAERFLQALSRRPAGH